MDITRTVGRSYITTLLVLIAFFIFSGISSAVSFSGINANGFSRSFNKFIEEKENFQKAQDDSLVTSDSSGLVEKGRSLLLATIDVLEKRSLQIEDRINSDKNIYRDLAPYMTDEIKLNLSKLNELRLSVANSVSLEELRQISLRLTSYRQDDEKDLRKLILLAHVSRFQDTILKMAQNRLEVINQKLSALKKSTKEISSLEKLSNQAEQYLSETEESINLLKENISKELISLSDTAQIQKQLIAITDKVKDTYKIFRQIAVDGNKIFYESLP